MLDRLFDHVHDWWFLRLDARARRRARRVVLAAVIFVITMIMLEALT